MTMSSDGFKETPIGTIPAEWDVKQLGDLFDIKQGKALSPRHREGKNPKPFLRTANVYWGKIDLTTIDKMDFTEDEVSELKLKTEDLLVCEGGDIGRTAMWNGELEDCCYQNHLHRLRPTREDVHPKFYAYWMQAAYQVLNLYGGYGNKTTIPNLSQARLKTFELPLPPLLEQCTIASILSKIQQAIETQEKIIERTKELKKSLMAKLFTEGLHGEELKKTEIGLMPKSWDVLTIDELFQIKQGKSLSPKQRKGINPKPFLRTSNVFWGRIDLSVLDEMDFTKEEVQALRLRTDDLLVCEGGDIGRTAIWSGEVEECCFQNHLHRLRTERQEVYPLFYMYWMEAGYRILNLYGGFGNKTTIPNLSQSRLKTFAVPHPILEEQKSIADAIGAVDGKIKGHVLRLLKMKELFKSMLHQLMTGKIRVNNLESIIAATEG